MLKENKPLDTYFFNAQKALEIAKEQNRVETSVKVIDALQLCYYSGEEKLESAPINCIHVPLENVFNYFSTSTTRIPKAISFEQTEFSMPEQAELNAAFGEILGAAKNERMNIVQNYNKSLKDIKPNFKDKKLRVFIPACRETTVMQYAAKNIAEAFEEIGCEVYYHIQNELEDCHILPVMHQLYNFNPHIIININHLNDKNLNENVFHFSWFQDPMPILTNNEKITLRNRDYIFSLIDMFAQWLLKKNVSKDKIFKQSFATNPKVFYRDYSIKKENKIVFLGSDYSFEDSFPISENCKNEVYNHIDNNTITNTNIKEIIEKYGLDYETFNTWVITSLVRRRIILWLCSIENIKVEIYGTDKWLKNPEVVPFYKGLLPYGEEMAKVYNSAKYAVAVHPHYMYQQRVIEMSACGAIPLIYKGHLLKENFEHEDNILAFSTKEELIKAIGKTTKKDPMQISEDISYKAMALKILNIVDEEIKG